MREEYVIQRKIIETGNWFTVMAFTSDFCTQAQAVNAMEGCKLNCPEASYRLIKRTTTVEEEVIK